jgi:hypothetical protein
VFFRRPAAEPAQAAGVVAHHAPALILAQRFGCGCAVGFPQTYLDTAKELNLLSLYEQRLNRAVHKKRAELAELQRVRKVARAANSAQPAINGFGFSNDQTVPPPRAFPAATDLSQLNIASNLRAPA